MTDDTDTTISWITRIARVGWLSKGLVFAVIGIIALRIATTQWKQPSAEATQTGALRVISSQTAGAALLIAVSAGLIVFMVWNIVQALIPDSTEIDLVGVAKRIGWFGLGLFYGAVAVAGFRMATNSSASGSSKSETSPTALTARLLGADGGRLTALIIAAVVLVVAGYHFHKGVTYGFVDDLDTDGLSSKQEDRLGRLGVGGFVARAFVLAVVAGFLAKAAIEFDADEAVGLDGALREFASLAYGRVLIAVVGLGFALAGTYDMVTFKRQRLR